MSVYQPGALISGKYRIVRLIGDGGMGAVYEARHEVLGSGVALKFLHEGLAKRPGLTERFLQEGQVSATIQSPHVVRVTDVDTAQDGSPYLVMELLGGQSLQAMLDHQGRLPLDQAIDFGLQILAGLEAAHAIGVVHRDLKPDNVFVTPSHGGPLLKLIDFGIAKLRAASEYNKGLTRAGVVMGTPEYMAPEQLLSAHTTDHRADLYSLGVMLFEMLAGCRPADGDDAEIIVLAVQSGRVRHLRDVAPGLPDGLVTLIEHAMAPDRERRFESATEMRLALSVYAGTLSQAGRAAAQPPTVFGPPLTGSVRPPAPATGVPKTLPPDGPALSVSQLSAARTSLSQAIPAALGRPATGTQLGGPQAYGPPPAYPAAPYLSPSQPARRKGGSGWALALIVVVVLGGGGAIGYAAYRAADRRVVVPQLPEPAPLPPTSDTVEKINPDSPDVSPSTTTTERNPVPGRPQPPTNKPPTGSAGAPPITAAGGAPSTGAGGSPSFPFPFPLPSAIQLPPGLPSALPLPPAITFPPGFPGFPPQNTATPAPTTAGPSPAPSPTPTASPTSTRTRPPRQSTKP